MVQPIEKVRYSQEFKLIPDDGNIYHLPIAGIINKDRERFLKVKDRHGRERMLRWGTKVQPLPREKT